jgi:hypothetical protein
MNTKLIAGLYLFLLPLTALAQITNDYGSGASGGGTGDASAANQVTQITKLTAIQAGTDKIPASPATAGNQATAIASLSSIDGKIPASPSTAGNQTSELTKLDTLITNTNKIPASPSQEHTTAASPNSCRLSDGAAFISSLPITVDGVKTTAATLPAGGSGAIGWLSAIANYLAGTLTVGGSVSVTNFPSNQAITVDGTKTTAAAMPAGGTGAIGWLSAIANYLAGTLTVSGTVSTTPPSNASTNIAQINGVTPLMGNGVTGTGSLRVTLASDNTSNTNPFLMNVGQFGGTNLSTGTGAGGAGIPRVTVSNDTIITTNDGGTKTTASTMPAGGVGATGWLSAIYDGLKGTLNTVAAAIWIKAAPTTVATYYFGGPAITPPTTATSMIQIRGSASKKVRVQSLVICPSATTAGAQTVLLRKQSALDTGGTSAGVSIGTTNSTQAAATGTVISYTVNPTTPGALVGSAVAKRVFFQITAGTTTMPPCTDLIDHLDSGELFTLNSTSENLTVSNNGAALAAGYKIDAWWGYFTEE